jgi:hypothetical protein
MAGRKTYIRNTALRQFPIPLVLDLSNLVASRVDEDFGVDSSLFAQTLNLVHGSHIHFDWVARGGDFMVLALDGGESGLETVLEGRRC